MRERNVSSVFATWLEIGTMIEQRLRKKERKSGKEKETEKVRERERERERGRGEKERINGAWCSNNTQAYESKGVATDSSWNKIRDETVGKRSAERVNTIAIA